MTKLEKKAEDQEVNSLLQELMGASSTSTEKPETKSLNINNVPTLVYQLPVKVGKTGKAIADGDQPWVVGTFAPKRYLNETHPQGHAGVDLKAVQGTPVYAIGPGTVLETGSNPKGGQAIKITHEDGHVISYYAHLSQISVTKGQPITLGTIIGAVGETGNAKGRGAHLHYEVSVDGNKVDPASVTGRPIGSLSQQKKAETYLQVLKIIRDITI